MFKTINSRIIFYTSIISIIIFGIFSYLFLNHQYDHLIGEVFRGASRFSDTVARSTRYDMLLDNSEGVHRMIETIGNQKGIDFVRIFNKEGKIMFSTRKKEMGNYVDKNAEACYICHAAEKPLERLTTTERSRIFQGHDQRILAMITPIYNEPDCSDAPCHVHSMEQRVLGVIDIGMSLKDVDNKLNVNRITMILFFMVAILSVLIILTFFTNRFITKPVKQLVEATRQVATGNLDVNIPLNDRSNDEITYLAHSFNRMIKDLKRANDEIQSLNITLEKKVEERTEKLRMAKEQLIRSEKMASLGILASSVAHEINNPLQGVFTYIKLMLKIINWDKFDIARLPDFKKYLGMMGNEIERCGDIVKNLLVFSKQSKPDIQKTDVNGIIKNGLDLLKHKIRLQNIEVDLKLQENIPSSYCDFKQILQTIIAIIINAIEAMPDGGKLTIETKNMNPNKIEISISDTGIGIPGDKIENIFDPFFSTKEESKSTGLGLFVAYGIIKEHNGTIEVESEEGKGTIFRITLPVNE